MKTIPFLDYYRVDRAAKFIGCEVEDIIHWGASGKIKLCVMLDMANSIFCSSMKVEILNNDLRSLPNHTEEFKELTQYSFIYNDDSIYNEDVEFFFKDDLFNPDSNSDGDFSNNIAYGHASGLWKLEQKAVMKLEMRNFYDDGLIVLPSGDMNLEGFFCCLLPDTRDYSISTADLWITREYVERILSNDLSTKIIQKPLESAGIKSVKLSKLASERHAKKREVVLVAAIFCKEKYPDECSGSIRAWANCIEKRATELLYKNGESPLSLDRIERILGKAIVGKLIVN